MNENCQPCERLKEVEKMLQKHEENINQTHINLAVINTKLGLIIAILGAVGLAILSLVIKQFWG